MELENARRIRSEYHSDVHCFIKICVDTLGKDLVSIILFGSIARGTAHQWSDFDFYVVTKKDREKDKHNIMFQFKKNCDVVMRTQNNIGQYISHLNALDIEVFHEGIVIYGKDILKLNMDIFLDIKNKYGLVPRIDLGKGVWEIGLAS